MTDWRLDFQAYSRLGWAKSNDRYHFTFFFFCLSISCLWRERSTSPSISLSVFFFSFQEGGGRLSRCLCCFYLRKTLSCVSITLSLLLRWIRQAPCLPFVSAVVDGSSSSSFPSSRETVGGKEAPTHSIHTHTHTKAVTNPSLVVIIISTFYPVFVIIYPFHP